jgi:hypothetical protein
MDTRSCLDGFTESLTVCGTGSVKSSGNPLMPWAGAEKISLTAICKAWE